MSNNSFVELTQSYSHAYMSQDWDELVRIGEKVGALIGLKNTGNVKDIREVAKIYLGSLLGSGAFLSTKDIDAANQFTHGLARVEKYATENDSKFITEFSSLIKSGYEIQLYLTSKQSDSRNKAAAALRKLARPDLAIYLASQQLEITRLNYYSLVVRSAAYSDLFRFENAISDGKKALKYSPLDKKHFPLVSLSRAYIERFKQTGDIEDYFEDYVDSLNNPQNPHLEP